jgi:hypothetical protein
VLVGAGTFATYQSIQAYLIDAFTLHAASGAVSASLLSAYRLSGHHSSCGRYVLALVGRLWIPVVCSDDVQGVGLWQR